MVTVASGVHRAVVTRLDGDRVYVKVPRLSATEFGPAEVAEGPYDDQPVVVGTEPAHSHTTQLAKGQRVVVAFIEGRPNDLIVLARLR